MTPLKRSNPQLLVERWIQAINRHDLDAIAACFAPAYHDEAPARRGELVQGQAEVRQNEAALLRDIPNIQAKLLGMVADGSTVWMEWRMYGTRADGTSLEFVGVNIFGVEGGQFVWGRIYTELVREVGGIKAQIERMTSGGATS